MIAPPPPGDYRLRINWLGAAALLALGIGASVVTSTVVASRAYVNRARHDRDITVKGSARQRIRSDLAIWRITVSSEAETLAKAYADLETGMVRVQAFLAKTGFPAGEIALGPVESRTNYRRDEHGNETREVATYSMSRHHTVTTTAVERVSTSAGEITALIKDGVQVVSSPPAYTFAKAAEIKVQLVGAATADGRARADEIARNAGCRIGGVKAAQMGVMQFTQPDSTDVSGGGIYDTTTIDKDVSVVVTATFVIDPR